MPRWSGWKNLVVIVVVCAGHLALLAGFSHSFASGKPAKTSAQSAGSLVITLLPATSKPSADVLATTQQQTSKNADVLIAGQNQKSDLPETPFWSGLPSRTYFLDTDAVDATAEPSEDFEAVLARLLPRNIEAVVLEFWIEKDGRTVEVKCLDGACNDDVLASLPKLADLVFTPAQKNGEAVANRKVIQIDIKPGLGL